VTCRRQILSAARYRGRSNGCAHFINYEIESSSEHAEISGDIKEGWRKIARVLAVCNFSMHKKFARWVRAQTAIM
jgi:hypothetical protein